MQGDFSFGILYLPHRPYFSDGKTEGSLRGCKAPFRPHISPWVRDSSFMHRDQLLVNLGFYFLTFLTRRQVSIKCLSVVMLQESSPIDAVRIKFLLFYLLDCMTSSLYWHYNVIHPTYSGSTNWSSALWFEFKELFGVPLILHSLNVPIPS